MADGLAPAPREQGWLRVVLALAAFLLLPHAPVLRAIAPVEETALLLLPVLAACFVVGWWGGGSVALAVLWTAFAIAFLAAPVPSDGRGAYWDLARAWGLLVAGTFGAVCVLGRPSAFLSRALAGIGFAMLLALLLVALGRLELGEARLVFARQFAARNATTAVALQAWVDRVAGASPSASEWAAAKALLAQRVSASFATPLFPALLALEALATCALAWALYHRLSRARMGAPLGRLRDFAFPDQLVWGLVAGITLAVLPAFAPLAAPGWNLLLFFGTLYALRGLGILAWWLRTRGAAGLALLAVATLLFFWLVIPAALALGITDTWIDWRGRARAAESPTRSGPVSH